ncbi:MAG: hypothetical protein IPO90_04385 [Flavobacteriales bacterium]|nr:hypothetical protein [Flavobacteriales bacterium]
MAQTWLDPTFGVVGTVEVAFSSTHDMAYCAAIQPDGKIVVAGDANLNIGPGVGHEFLLARFEADGSLDPSFGSNGMATHDVVGDNRVFDIELQPDGRIVVVGWNRNTSTLLVKRVVLRFSADGTIDSAFGNAGVLLIDTDYGHAGLTGVALQNDGKIVVVGHGGSPNYATFFIARINSDGTLDNTFAGGTGQFEHTVVGGEGWAIDVAIMDDGRIVSVGGAQIPDQFFPIRGGVVIRYLSDGTLDPTFGNSGIVLLDTGLDMAQDVAVYSDGRILVTGSSCYDCNTGVICNRPSVSGRYTRPKFRRGRPRRSPYRPVPDKE